MTDVVRDLAALPDGSVVVHRGSNYDAPWVRIDSSGVRWEQPVAVGDYSPDTRSGRADANGDFHFYVYTSEPSRWAVSTAMRPALVEVRVSLVGAATGTLIAPFGAYGDPVRGADGTHYLVGGSYSWPGSSDTLGELTHLSADGRRDWHDGSGPFGWLIGRGDGTSVEIWSGRTELLFRERDRRGAITGSVSHRATTDVSGNPSISIYDAVERPDGRLLLGGAVRTHGELDDWSHDVRGDSDAFLVELDPCGGVLWVRTFASSGDYDSIQDMTLLPDGAVLADLETAGLVDVDGVTVGDARLYRGVILRIAP